MPDPDADPTRNVISLVREAMHRQDDMRTLITKHTAETIRLVSAHAAEMAQQRADSDQKLREAETARINAIRAVDVGAVSAAAQVSATQATTLAAQVAASAETLRTQVAAAATAAQAATAAAATAATTALAAALEPIQKDIADLRRVQYEGAGAKTQVVESRDTGSDARDAATLALNRSMQSRLNISTAVGVVLLLATIITLILYATKK
jgi:membrane-associated HD superfamily phosphohydrolase